MDISKKPKLHLQNITNMAIEPISCGLNENMKAHIEMIEWTNNNFQKYATRVLMIPKIIFGRK